MDVIRRPRVAGALADLTPRHAAPSGAAALDRHVDVTTTRPGAGWAVPYNADR